MKRHVQLSIHASSPPAARAWAPYSVELRAERRCVAHTGSRSQHDAALESIEAIVSRRSVGRSCLGSSTRLLRRRWPWAWRPHSIRDGSRTTFPMRVACDSGLSVHDSVHTCRLAAPVRGYVGTGCAVRAVGMMLAMVGGAGEAGEAALGGQCVRPVCSGLSRE